MDVAEDTGNERWHQALAFLLAGVVVAAAVGLLRIVTDGGATSSPSDGATVSSWEEVSWDGGRLDRDRLTLYFTGAPPAPADNPCARAYEAVAEPTGGAMVVTVRGLAGSPMPPGQGCEDIGYARSVTVDLPEPLQGRTVIDGASGQRRAVSDVTLLLTPSWLPAGYDRSRKYVESQVGTALDTQEWALDGHPNEGLLVEQGSADELARPRSDAVVLRRPTVRGRAGDGLERQGIRRPRLRVLGRRSTRLPCLLERAPRASCCPPAR